MSQQQEKQNRVTAVLYSLGVHLLVVIIIVFLVSWRAPEHYGKHADISGNSFSLELSNVMEAEAPMYTTSQNKPYLQLAESPMVVTATEAGEVSEATPSRELPAAVYHAEANIHTDQRGSANSKNDASTDDPSSTGLELSGWTWNEMPTPKIPPGESGRVVFEIKIDANGEIISIKTLKRTISIEAAQTCEQAGLGATFTKTTNTVPDVTTGKITFIIKSR